MDFFLYRSFYHSLTKIVQNSGEKKSANFLCFWRSKDAAKVLTLSNETPYIHITHTIFAWIQIYDFVLYRPHLIVGLLQFVWPTVTCVCVHDEFHRKSHDRNCVSAFFIIWMCYSAHKWNRHSNEANAIISTQLNITFVENPTKKKHPKGFTKLFSLFTFRLILKWTQKYSRALPKKERSQWL